MAKTTLKIFKQERDLYARHHKTLRKQLRPIFKKCLKANIQPLLDYVQAFGVPGAPVETLINPNVWMGTYTKMFVEYGTRWAKQEYYYQRRLSQAEKANPFEVLRNVWTKIFTDYAINYVQGIVASLNQRTIELINDALGEGETLNLDRNGFIRWFYKKADQIVADRSQAFSVTEATRISNLGKEIGASQWIAENGGGGYKVWLGRINRERPAHLRLNDTILPIDQPYDMDGHDCMRPGDRNLPANLAIGCRCTQSFLTQTRYNAYLRRGRIQGGKLLGAS